MGKGAKNTKMNENEIATIVVDCAVKLHMRLESVYEVMLAHALKCRGLNVERQVRVSIECDGIVFDEAFRADLIVNSLVILEIKAIEKLDKIHKAQLLTYLKLTGKKLVLLVNFGEIAVKDGIHRVVNGLDLPIPK